MPPASPAPPHSSIAPARLQDVYRVFFWIGLFSFGGGLTAWIHREVVLMRGWMTDDEFFSGYALAQVLPGVNSTNIAIYVGQHVRGARGATVALIGMLSAPFFVVIAAAITYHQLALIPGFSAAMAGIAAAAVGMLFRVALSSARGLHRKPHSVIALLASFVAVGLLQWPLFPVLAVIAPLSVAAAWPRKSGDRPKAPPDA
jgi:chromate transporter